MFSQLLCLIIFKHKTQKQNFKIYKNKNNEKYFIGISMPIKL